MNQNKLINKNTQINMVSNSNSVYPGTYLYPQGNIPNQNSQIDSKYSNLRSTNNQFSTNHTLNNSNMPLRQPQSKYIQSNRNVINKSREQRLNNNEHSSQDYSRSLPPKQRNQQSMTRSMNQQPVVVVGSQIQGSFQYPSTLRDANINDKIKHLENMNIHYRQMIENIKNSKTESEKLKLLTIQIDQMTRQMARLQDQLGSSQISQGQDNIALKSAVQQKEQIIIQLEDKIRFLQSNKEEEKNTHNQNYLKEIDFQKNKIESLNLQLQQKNQQEEKNSILQSQYKEQLEKLQKDNQELLKQIYDQQKNQQQLQQKIEIQKTEILQKEKIIETKETNQNVKSEILQQYESQIQQLSQQIQDIQYKKDQKNYEQLNEQKQTYENLINLNKNLINQKDDEIFQLHQAQKIHSEERQQYQRNLQKQQDQIQQLMSEVYTLKLQLQQQNHQKEIIANQFQSQLNEIQQQKEVIQQLKKELAFLEGYQFKEISKKQSQEFSQYLEKEVIEDGQNNMNFKGQKQLKVKGGFTPKRQSIKTNQSEFRSSVQNRVQEVDSVYDKLQKVLEEASKQDNNSDQEFLSSIKQNQKYKDLIKELKAENYLNKSQNFKNEQDIMDILRQFPVNKQQLYEMIDDQKCKPKLILKFILDEIKSKFEEYEYDLGYQKNRNDKIQEKLKKDKEDLDQKVFELNHTIQNLKIENQSLIMSNSINESKVATDQNSQIDALRKENQKLKQELQKLKNHVRGKRQKMLSQLNQLVEDKSNFESSFLSSLSKTPKKRSKD